MKGSCGCEFLSREWAIEGSGSYGHFREQEQPVSVLNDFTDDALTISAGSLFQNGTVRVLKAYWRRRVKHLCWWNL